MSKDIGYWKIFCMEDKYPGLWRRWFINQVVTVGWPAEWGYKLEGRSKRNPGWTATRLNLKRINVGDIIVVHLKDRRVGRIGEVVRKEINDDEWNPLILAGGPHEDLGEMGRRILVRWLAIGPEDPDLVVQLPEGMRLHRMTLTQISASLYNRIEKEVQNEQNWLPVASGRFAFERSISDYIGTFPHRLEDGLTEYPLKKTREFVHKNNTRSDVFLLDKDKIPLVVECKQYAPTIQDVKQLCNYLRHTKKKTGARKVRGILVHGGAKKLSSEVLKALRHTGGFRIDTLRYTISVDFDRSD